MRFYFVTSSQLDLVQAESPERALEEQAKGQDSIRTIRLSFGSTVDNHRFIEAETFADATKVYAMGKLMEGKGNIST